MLPDDLPPDAGPCRVLDPDPPNSVAVVCAHPDDAEFGAGATLARWARSGTAVHLLVLTDGSRGSLDLSTDRDELVEVRRAEQQAAHQLIGGRGEILWGGWPDGALPDAHEQRIWLCGHLRRLRPDVVFVHDPWRRYRLHPDHRAAGFIGCDAVVWAREPLSRPELGSAHRPDALLLFEADAPDVVVPVEDVDVDAKVAALMAHVSQASTTMRIDADDIAGGRQRFAERISSRLREHGALVGTRFGEAFRLLEP